MPDPVSPVDSPALDLDEIRARLEGTTAPPWAVARRRSGPWIEGGPKGYDDVIAPADVDCGRYCQGGSSRIELSYEDAEFIAAARTDVPALVAEVERLRADRDRLTRELAELRQNPFAGYTVSNDLDFVMPDICAPATTEETTTDE